MRLQERTYYRTRDGRKAYVVAMDSPFKSTTPCNQAVGWIEGASACCSWDCDGSFSVIANRGNDLVAEWRDPAKRTADILLVEDSHDNLRTVNINSESARAHFGPPCYRVLAHKRVELVEGHFDDESYKEARQ